MKTGLCALLLSVVTAMAAPANAEHRICEGLLRGPAGEHSIRYLLEDGEIVRGLATWSPPNQTARQGGALPRMILYYRISDLETGARGPLMFVHMMHAARVSDTSATSATVGIRRYGEDAWLERREWAYFASAVENSRRDDLESMASTTGFGSAEALELFMTAPQVESNAVTNEGVQVSSGVWNLSYRTALDALFDRAFQEVRRRLQSRSECRRPLSSDASIVGGNW